MKLLADECVPRRTFDLLRDMRPPAELVHLLERFAQGAKDDSWVREIAAERPGFLVLTGDTGAKSGSVNPRLPSLLPQFGITGVFFSGKIQQMPGFHKARAIMSLWPKIEAANQAVPGSRFKILLHSDGFRMVAWPRL